MRLDGGGDTGASRKGPVKDEAFAALILGMLEADTEHGVKLAIEVIQAYLGR